MAAKIAKLKSKSGKMKEDGPVDTLKTDEVKESGEADSEREGDEVKIDDGRDVNATEE
jgi:hypothetical protein